MRRVATLVLLVLAACAPEEAVFMPVRDTSVPITSSTRFDAARFAGDWHVVAAISATEIYPAATRYVYDGAGGFDVETLPSPGDSPNFDAVPVQYKLGGPGQLNGAAPLLPIWVLWVDEDHRTAVIGNPEGSFGEIINRTPVLRADRFRAAAEVLKFNGYDTTRLRTVAR